MKLHATLLIGAICALLYVFLSLRVVLGRFRGDKLGVDAAADRQLHIRIRIHGNFIEYVPFALLMMGFLEISGANQEHLLWLGAVLIAARLAHAAGLPLKAPNPLRAFGITATLAVLVAESVYAFRLLD
ncbi:MAG: MAPEG family protein [Burkholderiaceae bacterium]|nr:MAPEG family protein [Burkholderiaceae bacterium]